MTVGFRIPGGTDLDAVFLARTSSPAAATGFKSVGGIDLNQRFEPRGSTTPVGNTGFRIAAGTDLALVFKAISAITATTHTLTAGSWFQSVSSTTHTGFGIAAVVVAGSSAFGSISPTAVGGNTVSGFWWSDDGNAHVVFDAGATPADADSAWQSVNVTGTFQGGVSTTKTLTRSARSSSSTTGTRRRWDFVGSDMAFASGNIYTVTFNRV